MDVTIDWKLLGGRLKEARKRHKLTQEKLGEKVGISASYISRIETGKDQMSMYRFFTLAVYLQVPPVDLLTGCCPNVVMESRKPSISPDKSHMYELIDRASAPMLKTMCAVCDGLMSNADSL